jgi:uncharacterized protein YdaU (DUF1376 family)
MPEPLTPEDCDCRGLPFMPLEVARFTESDFAAISTGDEFKAAVLLWAKSWTQVPAASLPDNDRILARMTGYTLAEWLKLREMALHNWIKCSDGRLYHPVIADLAVAAVAKRKGQSERANTRWAKVRAEKAAEARAQAPAKPTHMPRHKEADAMAPKTDATVMQGTGKEEGIEPPLSPPKGTEDAAKPPKVRKADVEAIWTVTPSRSRERSSKADLERALTSAASRGHPPDAVKSGLEAYFRSAEATRNDGEFVKGVHRMVERDRWQSFTETSTSPESPAEPDDPWRFRLMNWRRNAAWNRLEWGPPPGKPGCTVPAEVLMAHGYVPTGQQNGAAA